ncbi:hypothetical protein BDW69DRAFT_190993 [Aspergillus filifer]
MNQTRETNFPLDKLPKSVKVRSTCNACQQAKIRCSHDKPSCNRCQKHNIECIYSISRRLGRPAKKRDQNADSDGNGPLSKKTRAPKRKKIKEEPTPDFGAKDQSAEGDDKPLFDALALDQGHVDDISVDNTSMQTPTLMDIVSAAPFSMPENLDMSSDSWLHEFMPNPFTDPPPGCAFPFESDMKLDDTTTTPSMDLDSLPLPSEAFSDSTSEGLDPPSSSSFYTAVNSCLPHTGPLSSHRGLPNNSVYPGHPKEELFSWTQNIGSLGANFGESSLFTQLNMSKRGHGYSFAEDESKTDINSLSNTCPSQTHDQAIGDLIRVYSYTSQPGSTIAIDSILTCQRVLQQLTETMLQCRGCARIKVNDLMMVMLSIENLIIALDTITAAENDVVERLFPEHFGSLAQEYRAESGLTSHARRLKGGSVQLKKQLDACPLIIGGFCVPSEEKCVFVKRMLQRRLAGLQRTVQRIQVYAQEFLASSTSTGKMLTMKDIYEKLQLVTVKLKMLTRPIKQQGPTIMSTYLDLYTPEETTCLSSEALDRIIYQLILASMESETTCQCSIGALQIMNELRGVQTFVELETILSLVERIYNQGQTMLKCKDCRANPKSTLMTLPALADQSLALFESACLAYNISRKEALFDPSLPQFLCIRSKIQLGQMELDEDETGVLVRMLLGKNSRKLLELLKALRVILKDCGQSHRSGVASLRACEASVEPPIHRIAVFIEQVETESDGETYSKTCSARPRALKMSSPLTPTNHLASHRLLDVAFPDLIRSIKIKRFIESDDGVYVTVDSVSEWSCGSNIRASQHRRNEAPTGEGKATSAVLILLDIIWIGSRCSRWYTKE